MIDNELIGKTTMQLLDHMESDPKVDGGKIISVGVACVVENEDETETFTRIWCSDEIYYQQIGIFMTALEVIRGGLSREEEEK